LDKEKFFAVEKFWLIPFGLYPTISVFNLVLMLSWIGSFICIVLEINFMIFNNDNIKEISMLMPEFSATVVTFVKVTLFIYHRKKFKYLYERIELEWNKSEIDEQS
jgi:membrane protein YdbS with pleckstrin-like domain